MVAGFDFCFIAIKSKMVELAQRLESDAKYFSHCLINHLNRNDVLLVAER
jgi:hypothetical protein